MPLKRRTFLTAALATGLAARTTAEASAAPLPQDVDFRGRSRADLPTPALLVDLDAFEANLKTLAAQCKTTGCGFRPHAKTHKCPEIARRQVSSGALGV